jgi:peptidoglycan/LPS O-acetylase OafA/YrhL
LLKSLSLQRGTFGDLFNPRNNALTLSRFLLAVAVVVSHSFPLGGISFREPLVHFSRGQIDAGSLAVDGFFILSGILITRSYESTKNFLSFAWRRALRILPALWASLALVAFVFAPLAWVHEHHTFASYWGITHDSPWHYLTSNALVNINQWNIGNLLSGTPFAKSGAVAAWNGSLWTLIYEVKCYVIVGVLGFLGLLKRRRFVAGMALFFFILNAIKVLLPTSTPLLFPASPSATAWFFMFFLGATVWLYREAVPLDDRYAIAAFFLMLLTLRHRSFELLGVPAFGYFLVWWITRLKASSFERWGDPSYGTYVYAFPIQMLLAEYGWNHLSGFSPTAGSLIYIGLSIGFAVLAGYLSWWILEKQAMKLKGFYPKFARRFANTSALFDEHL